VQFSKNGNLLKEVRLGSNLADLTEVSALAYPKGPKKSELSKIILKRLNVPEGLANHQLEIKTESPLKIEGSQSMEFPPTDERFDQVQAYYYANQILSWFGKKLTLKRP